jgi:hypothetical protein
MKIAVIANQRLSFSYPMGLSMKKMLDNLGYEVEMVFEENISRLLYSQNELYSLLFKNIVKSTLNIFRKEPFEVIPLSFTNNFDYLKKYDAIIVVAHMPMSLSYNAYKYVDQLRKITNKPIINYDLCFWSTMGKPWMERIKKNPSQYNFTGLDRFDYYLVISNITEYPQNNKKEWPVSIVGGDFRNSNLSSENKKEFSVLVDFDRPEHPDERKIQMEVLEELKIPYTILNGRYTYAEICQEYSKHAAYFLAHRESFGLPIIELQHCGAYILTPYKHWAPSHYINKDIDVSGEGELSPNFVVYENNKALLKEKLISLRNEYNAKTVVDNFSKYHPHLVAGDLENLKKIMEDIKNGAIDGSSHLKYIDLENHI